MGTDLNKAFGLPEGIDPNHQYVYRSGEHGIYDFWYKDNFENYWLYTNAPQDHPDYDAHSGEAMLVPDQPMPHTAPQFYTEEGRKLHIGIPPDAQLTKNPAYQPDNPKNIWYAMYQKDDETRFVYYDTDVRENLDLWVQYNIRVCDAVLVKYRQFAAKLFQSPHPKDKVIAGMLMLADQGVYEAYDLVNATVGDVEYIDMTVKLLGRKLVCDPPFVDYFTSLTADRDPSEPLFMIDTVYGRQPIGLRHFYSLLKALRMSSHFLMYWHASHLYSRIVHRLAADATPIEEVEERALAELTLALGAVGDVEHMVDFQLKETLMSNYELMNETEDPEQENPLAMPGEEDEEEPQEEVNKGLMRATQDDFGVMIIISDLAQKKPDEFEFSQWLHSEPLHDISEEEEEALVGQLEEEQKQAEQMENAPNESSEGAAAESGSLTQGTSPTPSEGELPSAGEADQ